MDAVYNTVAARSGKIRGGKCWSRSLGWEQITSWGGHEVGGTTEGQTLGEELVLQPPVGPVLLRLAMDLHVSVTGLDFVEHSGANKEGRERRNLKECLTMKTICLFALMPNAEKSLLQASFLMTGATYLPHNLQGKKLANGVTGTAPSRANCLSTG